MAPQSAGEAVSVAAPEAASGEELARFKAFLRQRNGGSRLSANDIVHLFEEFQKSEGR